MIKNYIKIAFRTMLKNKVYSISNILGLTIGLTASMLVFTIVADELSYDRFWSRAEDLYKVILVDKKAGRTNEKISSSPVGLGYALKEYFPELEEFSSISQSSIRFHIDQDNPDGIETAVVMADTNVLKLLDYQAVSGHRSSYIAGHQNLLITQRFKEKHFAHEDPVGKIIEDVPSWSTESQSYVITGIIEDVPPNTHLRADAVVLEEPAANIDLTKEGFRGLAPVFYLLKPGTDPIAFTEKINNWYRNFMENERDRKYTIELQSFTDIYLHSDFNSGLTIKGNIRTVHILIAVGILLLVIACVNYINLTLAHCTKRLKELGVRKTFGAERKQLMIQFIFESLLFFFTATSLALMLYAITIPVMESFIGHALADTILSHLSYFYYTLLSILLVSLLTGIYPAWWISGFDPVNTLKGKTGSYQLFGTAGLRKALVTLQFVISIIVLVGMLVVQQQVNFLSHKDIGYDKENLLHIGLRSWEGKGQTFKNELKKYPGIVAASIAGWDPVDGSTTSFNPNIKLPHKDDQTITAHFIEADMDFVATLGFKLEEGRLLDDTYGMDRQSNKTDDDEKTKSYLSLITMSTAKLLDIKEAGMPISVEMSEAKYKAEGILKDFHRESLHNTLTPLFILGVENPDYSYMFIRTKPGSAQVALQSLTKVWKEFYPNRLLDAQWMTDIIDKQYQAEQKQQTLFSFFSGLMLFLSALGVFGLIAHAAQQRTKEIGIRKVLGASLSGLVTMLSKDFVKLVVIAIIIASPIAWWAMNKWLEDFAYRIDIEWWMFAAAGLAALVIALLTVSWQAIRAAVANPVDSLRDE